MKNLFRNAFLFIILSIVFSSLSGCQTAENSKDNQPKPDTNAPANNNPNNYPLAPSVILNTEIKTIDGTTFKISDKKGKVLLLNLWATWCGPCRNEMPHLVEMQEKYREKDFEVIGLNTDNESVESIKKFASEMKLNYTQAYSTPQIDNEFIKLSRLNGIPQTLVLDRENRLTGVFAGGSAKVIKSMTETVEKVVNQ